MVTLNKANATILVCAAHDFRKKLENAEFEIFFKEIGHKQKIKCLVFFKSARRVCNHMHFN